MNKIFDRVIIWRYRVNTHFIMKRFIVTTILTVVIIGTLFYFLPQPFNKTIAKFIPQNAKVCVYCRNTSLQCVDMGLGKKVYCSLSAYNETVKQCDNVDGLSVSFNGTQSDVRRLIYRLRLNSSTVKQIDNISVVCGYSALITGGVIIDGVKVNCQIAYSNGMVTVGFPLILGDY